MNTDAKKDAEISIKAVLFQIQEQRKELERRSVDIQKEYIEMCEREKSLTAMLADMAVSNG